MNKNQKNKFKTPDGYFESFNERLMNRLNEETGNENSPIPKSDGFAVPEGYFEGIYPSISKQLQEDSTKVVHLTPRRIWYYAAAAVVAIVVITFAWNSGDTTTLEFSDLAETEITDYFEDTDFELSSYEIADLLPIENIAINDVTETSWDNDQVMEYLEETVEDFDELNLDYDELEK